MVRSGTRSQFDLASATCRVLAALLALTLPACTRSPSTSTTNTTLTIGTSIPPARDETAGVSAAVKLLTLEAPVGVGWDGRPIKRAVDNWKWSADGLSLRLHLRPGIVFHDGTKLTNEIAANILREALKPSPGYVSATITSVEPEGTDEIVIRTTQPEGFLLSDISLADFAVPGKPDVGTGPFSRLEGKSKPIVLRAFDQYRAGRPAINTVQISEYTTQRQAWAAMMRGEADMLHDVSVESLDFVEAESTVRTFSFTKAY